MVDFEQDLNNETIKQINAYGVKYKSKDNLRELLVKLFSFLNRYVEPQKRVVKMSKELLLNKTDLPNNIQKAIDKMVVWVENGVDINCFQSRGLYKENRDYQNMLYGTVHLHLSAKEHDNIPVIKGNGFAKSSMHILIVYFTKDVAYFIDAYKHPESSGKSTKKPIEWTSKQLLEIIENNWPELIEKYKIEGATLCNNNGTPINMDDEAVYELTTNGINAFIDTGKAIYMPVGLGVSASQDSCRAIHNITGLMNKMHVAQKYYIEHEDEIETEIKNYLIKIVKPVPDNFDTHYEFSQTLNRYVIIEKNSGVVYDYTLGKLYLIA